MQLLNEIKVDFIATITGVTILRLLLWFPHWQVSQFGIINATENATLENQYRATIAQILGGAAIGISLYYTWRKIGIAEKDLHVTQENLIVAQDNLKVTQENLEITHEIAQESLKTSQDGQINQIACGHPTLKDGVC